MLTTTALSLGLVVGATTTSYADDRPHADSELVARAYAVGAPLPLVTTGLPTGAPPMIPYAAATSVGYLGGDWVLHRPDGTSLALPHRTWAVWSPSGNGAIGMAVTDAGPELQRVSGDGGVSTQLVQHFGLATSPDDDSVGWLTDSGRPVVLDGGATRPLALPPVARGRTIAAIGSLGSCGGPATGAAACTAYVDGRRHAWLATSQGPVAPAEPAVRVSDVSASGEVLALLPRREGHRCWGLERGGRRVFSTCASYLAAFSPTGSEVLAERAEASGAGVRGFAILDDTGQVVRAWTVDARASGRLTQLTWEDDDHLLGVLHTGARWAMVRVGTDGTVEYAGVPVAGTSELAPYSLPLR